MSTTEMEQIVTSQQTAKAREIEQKVVEHMKDNPATVMEQFGFSTPEEMDEYLAERDWVVEQIFKVHDATTGDTFALVREDSRGVALVDVTGRGSDDQ